MDGWSFPPEKGLNSRSLRGHGRVHWRSHGLALQHRGDRQVVLVGIPDLRGLPVAVAVKKKGSSHSVPSPRKQSYTDDPTCSTVQSAVSAEDIPATKEPGSSEAIKTKPLNKNVKLNQETVLPQTAQSEGGLEDKRQEFLKFRKQFIQQQNEYIDRYTQLRDMEARSGMLNSRPIGEVRVLSVTDWPAHDLLLMTEASSTQPRTEIKGVLGPKILQQLTVQLCEVRDEVLAMGTELIRRRLDILKFVRAIQRNENRVFVYEGQNIVWQTKNAELDEETTKLRELVLTTVKNVEYKLTQSLDAAKMPWKDRDNLLKKIECLQRELSILKKSKQKEDTISDNKKILEDLHRERASCARMKEMLAAAEDRATAARARCAELERQHSANANTSRPKWAGGPRQLFLQHSNCCGVSHDTHIKKSEPQKNEVTIEVLSRQRDALQLKVKEFQERATVLMQEAEKRESQLASLLSKLEDQEQRKQSSETLAQETEIRLKDLQEQYKLLQERCRALVEAQHMKCLEYLPRKVPCSCQDLDILYDLQATKNALGRVNKDLEVSRADKKGLNRLENEKEEELQTDEQTIANLQNKIEELTENKKIMEESLTCYENQISALRTEVSLLRSFNGYKSCDYETPHEELESQVFELCSQVERLKREREALASEAMARTLLLERHERCAEMFARVTRAKHELAAQLTETVNSTPSMPHRVGSSELSNLMSKTYLSSASTWSALRVERARVLRLEGVVHAQAQQLERESYVRIKQDRRRAQLERELLRTWATGSQSQNKFKEADTLTTDSLYVCKKETIPNLELAQ
ncbi:myosin-11-like [Cydia strobilella]|uniref:myosin-11-like n=1 Tax=Cydia strobilella TaxID=1100964 RepID=UPI0030071D5F